MLDDLLILGSAGIAIGVLLGLWVVFLFSPHA